MVQVLTYDSPTVVAALRSGYFRRMGVRVSVADSISELLRRTPILRPQVLILVAGQERCVIQQLRSQLSDTRTLILLAVPHTRREIEEDLRVCDGIVSLEDPELDLARILSSLIPNPKRRQARTGVRIPVRLFPVRLSGHEPEISGATIDLSSAGAGLHLSRNPGPDPYTILFYREDGRRVVLGARAVWTDSLALNAVRLGVCFTGASVDAVRRLFDLALWELVWDHGQPVIRLHGEISESTSLGSVLSRIRLAPTLDLGNVARINSAGVLRWVDMLQRVPSDVELRLRRLSIPLGRQMLLAPAMARRCIIESFFVPYECEECEVEATDLVAARGPFFAPPCPTCGDAMLVSEPLLALAETRQAQ